MPRVESCTLPAEALLNSYVEIGAYTDCFRCVVDRRLSHAEFVQDFYTTGLFKLERLILKYVMSLPATDVEAIQVANGSIDRFSAWRVEQRSENQLLMCDVHGRTRSWFMTEPGSGDQASKTTLYFGSAVTQKTNPENGDSSMGAGFNLLLGFHKLYSRALLYSASRNI